MAEVFTLALADGSQYPYKAVYSKRAKYIRIKISRQGLLSVIVPEFTKVKLAHDFIRSKRVWIEKHLAKVDYQKQEKLPEILDLKLLHECWTIRYNESQVHESSSIKHLESAGHVLELLGNYEQLNDRTLITSYLNQWCKIKAKNIFNRMLQELAEEHGFHYHRLSIRAQKTRWGSCSQQKNINLNCKLLFMPEEVVRYVMIHELCHTIEMNHSSRFWTLVNDCDPNYKKNRNELKALGREIVI